MNHGAMAQSVDKQAQAPQDNFIYYADGQAVVVFARNHAPHA